MVKAKERRERRVERGRRVTLFLSLSRGMQMSEEKDDGEIKVDTNESLRAGERWNFNERRALCYIFAIINSTAISSDGNF